MHRNFFQHIIKSTRTLGINATPFLTRYLLNVGRHQHPPKLISSYSHIAISTFSFQISATSFQHPSYTVKGLSTCIDKMSQDQKPKVLEVSNLENQDAKWTSLKKIRWQDEKGKIRFWEMAERTTRSEANVDAVAILAIVPIDGSPHVLCQKQFRPPIGKFCIEIPAGLVDSKESCEDAAIRELREETGYVGTVMDSTTVMYNDPGLTNANLKIILADIDMSKPENQNPQQQLDDGEYIENFPIKLSSLQEELFSLEKKGFAIDVRLSTFALGLHAGLKYLSS